MEDYKVKITNQRDVPNGAKLTVELIDKETGETVIQTIKGVDNRQLGKDDKYWREKLERWGQKLREEYEHENSSVENLEV